MKTWLRENLLTGCLLAASIAVAVGLFRPQKPAPLFVAAPFVNASHEPYIASPPFPKDPPLSKQIPQLTLSDGTTVEEALNAIGRAAGCEIRVNWNLLARAGVSWGTTFRILGSRTDSSAEAALDTIFHGIPYTTSEKIIYWVSDGTIHVSTVEESSQYTVTCIYNIRDLIDAYVGAAHNPTDRNAGPSRPEIVDYIVKTLCDTVAPDSWRDTGGSIGSIREITGLLIVTQSRENHNAFSHELEVLRRVGLMPPATKTAPSGG